MQILKRALIRMVIIGMLPVFAQCSRKQDDMDIIVQMLEGIESNCGYVGVVDLNGL